MSAVSAEADVTTRKVALPIFHPISRVDFEMTISSWRSMLRRCFNREDSGFVDYGGRGITVCERWFTFINFLHDMGPRPCNCTIERNDNDGNYEPGNCCWAYRTEQARNTRRNRKILVGDRVMLQVDAARLAGVSEATMMRRLKRGIAPEVALQNDRIKKNKLCRDQVVAIKCLIEGENRDEDIARQFHVTRQMIGQIRRGTAWPT